MVVAVVVVVVFLQFHNERYGAGWLAGCGVGRFLVFGYWIRVILVVVLQATFEGSQPNAARSAKPGHRLDCLIA